MDIERIKRLKANAERILNGDADNYDGADGARHVLELCKEIERLVAEQKK